ncbi:hypothetical protein DsansV1_C02g0017951 [Dioscorea sansibarensis]
MPEPWIFVDHGSGCGSSRASSSPAREEGDRSERGPGSGERNAPPTRHRRRRSRRSWSRRRSSTWRGRRGGGGGGGRNCSGGEGGRLPGR